jgi:hypothetical protein
LSLLIEKAVNITTPLRYAALAQVLAGSVVCGATLWLVPGAPIPLLLWACVHGFCAGLVAALLRLPRWWWLISFLFAPLAVLALGLGLPPWAWLMGFVLLLLVFWRTDSSRVPLYMSNATTAQSLVALLPAAPCRVIDLGCGDGRLLRQLAKVRPDSQFVGLEHAPLTWVWARVWSSGLANLHIGCGSFWTHRLGDLGSYDVVYAFLSPIPMSRLWDKSTAQAKPGSLLVSNSFDVPNVAPLQTVQVDDGRRTRLYVYQPCPPR